MITREDVKTIADLVNMASKVHGDKVFVRYEKDEYVKEVTYNEFLKMCESVAAWVEEQNKKHNKNVRIGIFGGSSKPFLSALFGIMSNGNVAIPLDVQLNMDTLVDYINRADIDYLFYDWDFFEMAEDALNICPELKGTVCLQSRKHVDSIYKIWKEYSDYSLKDDIDPKECVQQIL